MSTDFLPAREGDLISWTGNFAKKLLASEGALGVSPEQAEHLEQLQLEFAAAYMLANGPNTNSSTAVSEKNGKKAALINYARVLARIVRGMPTVSAAQKVELGLRVRRENLTAVARPESAPSLHVVSVTGRVVRVRLSDSTAPRRGRPPAVAGATILSCVSEDEPSSASPWRFETSTSRTTAEIRFPSSVPAGAQVFLSAFWYNPRSQRGAACKPVRTNLQGGAEALAA